MKMLVDDAMLIISVQFSQIGMWSQMRLYFYIVFVGSMLAWTWRSVLGEESRLYKFVAGNLSSQSVGQINMNRGFSHREQSLKLSETFLCSVEVRGGTKVSWGGMNMCVSVCAYGM